MNEPHEEAGSDLFGIGIPECDGFRKVVTGVDMNQGKWNSRRIKGLSSEMGHDNGVLTGRKQEPGILKLGRSFPKDENGFSLKLIEMAQVVIRHLIIKLVRFVRF